MTAPLSQTASWSMALQAAKGTAASTNFIRGRMEQSQAYPDFDEATADNEHTGVHDRPTSRQSITRRTGYIVPVSMRFKLRPDMIGNMFLGLGFEEDSSGPYSRYRIDIVSPGTGDTYALTLDDTGANPQTTSAIAYDATASEVQTALEALSNVDAGEVKVRGVAGEWYHIDILMSISTFTIDATLMDSSASADATLSGPANSHRLTIADAGDMGWLSIIQAIRDGGTDYERLIKDCRLANLQLEGNAEGNVVTADGFGLTSGEAAGTETHTSETDVIIPAGSGYFELTVGGSSIVSAMRGHRWMIENPLASDDAALFQFSRDDLPQTGLMQRGVAVGVDVTETLHELLNWDSGSAPSQNIKTGTLGWEFHTDEDVSGVSGVPYALSVDFGKVEVRLDPWGADGNNLVRGDVLYEMVDDVAATEPCTVTLVNAKSDYAGS